MQPGDQLRQEDYFKTTLSLSPDGKQLTLITGIGTTSSVVLAGAAALATAWASGLSMEAGELKRNSVGVVFYPKNAIASPSAEPFLPTSTAQANNLYQQVTVNVLGTTLAGLNPPASDYGLNITPYNTILEAIGMLQRFMLNTQSRVIRYDQERVIALTTAYDAFLGEPDQSFVSGSAWALGGGTFRTVEPSIYGVLRPGFTFAIRVLAGAPDVTLKPGPLMNGFGSADGSNIVLKGGESYVFTAVINDFSNSTANYWQRR